MKIMKGALLTVALGSGSLVLSSAFAPSNEFRFGLVSTGLSRRTSAFGGGLKHSTFTSIAMLEKSGVPTKQLSRNMASSDEEEGSSDGDDEGPLSNGIDSVIWLPSVVGAKNEEVSSARSGAEIMPLFPLGGIVYTPNSEHVLNIFEPRYRQMYTDILMNGSKRFVVAMSHPTEPGRFAETGVLFELEDLKEVSEKTEDQIKYICNHRVTGRVKLHRILNPEAWESRETYLKAEGTITDDTKPEPEDTGNDVYGKIAAAAGKPVSKEEKALCESFADLVEIQHELEEDVRFTRASVNSLAVGPGPGKDGLWQTIRLWQSYAEQRLVARQNELQKDFQEKLQEFLTKEKGLKDEELPSAIGFQDLSPALQQEVQELQKRIAVEMQPLLLEQTLTMQKILEAEDHKSRCNLLRYFIDAERKRLSAKKSLQGMFKSDSGTSKLAETDSLIPPEEQLDEDNSSDEGAKGKPSSFFTDEPDAFQ